VPEKIGKVLLKLSTVEDEGERGDAHREQRKSIGSPGARKRPNNILINHQDDHYS
jgi:hypothetical protein